MTRRALLLHPSEGLRAGALGGTVAWLWFFAAGWIEGDPLHVAGGFGSGLLGLFGTTADERTWQPVLAFTIVYLAYWCLLAVITLKFVHAATHNASVLSLGLTVFILFQFLLVGITAILSNATLGAFAWSSVLAGNVAGWVAAGWFIVRRHPELRTEIRHMDDDT